MEKVKGVYIYRSHYKSRSLTIPEATMHSDGHVSGGPRVLDVHEVVLRVIADPTPICTLGWLKAA